MQTIKCFLIGDRCSERTRLWVSYVTNSTDSEYVPTVFDNYSMNIKIDGKPTILSIWDIVGLEDSDSLRPFSYEQTDVFLVCYSVVSPLSFCSVRDKWFPEIRHYCPDKPIILVGTQTELRKDKEIVDKLRKNKLKAITNRQARSLARDLGAVKYLECSLVNLQEVRNVFNEALLAVLCPQIKTTACECIII